MSPRFSLTLIGAGLGLAVSASVFTAQVITQKFMPPEWCLLLLAGTTGTGAIVGRISDRRPLTPTSLAPLTHSATALQPHTPENQQLYTETCTTIAHHLCQVPTGTEEYQEALIAGAATTANLRAALAWEQPRSRWQDAVSRWQAASVSSSDHAIDAISGAPTMFSSPSQEEPSHADDSTPPAPSDSGGSALPDPPQSLFNFLGSGSSCSSTPPMDEPIAAGVGAGVGASSDNGSRINLDDEWDQPIHPCC